MSSMELSDSLFSFIASHEGGNINELALRYSGRKFDFSISLAMLQLKGRHKYGEKLRPFFNNERFLLPDSLAAEQSSHHIVAAYHASIVGKNKRIADMTAGLGIDAMSIALAGNVVDAFELEGLRVETLRHNADVLSIDSLKVMQGNSVEIMRESDVGYDLIFIDPARRDSNARRTYSFRDCEPDISSILPMLFEHAPTVIIKASPLLDIVAVSNQLVGVAEIMTVSYAGECKEVLVVCREGFKGSPEVSAVMLHKSGRVDKFFIGDSSFDNVRIAPDSVFSEPRGFIYQPDAALMKLNCAASLCSAYDKLMKIAPNTQLYFSEVLYPDFPGRITEIESVPDKRSLKSIKGEKINAVARNYPLTSEEMMKKYGLKPGESRFLYGLKTSTGTPMLLLTRKPADI